MGKLEWGTILVLCGLSVGSIRADDGRQRSIAAEEIQVKEYVMGTTRRIDGMRLRISEDPDPMACATSGIKKVEIVERTKMFRGHAAISDNDLQPGDHVIVDAAQVAEI